MGFHKPDLLHEGDAVFKIAHVHAKHLVHLRQLLALGHELAHKLYAVVLACRERCLYGASTAKVG